MKPFYTILILISILFFEGTLTAQTATEAYRFSISEPLGTARNLGAGNSMFAIGPDFSAIGSNPAGIGAYWKSEFTVTAGGLFNSFSAFFPEDGGSVTEGHYNYGTFPNCGFILVNRPREGNWMTSNWAVGINRMADYRRDFSYQGSTLGSMTDFWRDEALGKLPDNLNGFEEGLAWNSGAIYDFEEDRSYESDYQLSPEYPLYKVEHASLEGGKSEFFLGYGANIDNQVLFGASFNMPIINSTEFRDYEEIDGLDNGVPYFNRLNYTSFINSTGYGVNGKFGITLRPNKSFNLSFAAHTPTKYFMTDDYHTSLSYDYTDQEHDGPIYSESPYGSFHYAIVSPWSLMGGLGIIVEKQGFIGVSLKWTDYGAMHYDYSVDGNGYYYEQEEQQVNEDIQRSYNSALDINAGGEIVMSAFRLRGGVSFNQSPYTNDEGFDPSYHAGLGWRSDAFYIDFGYRWSKVEEGYQPYETTSGPEPLVVNEVNRHTIAATVGLKF